ncbi:unnamed protein product [Gemmataceae bacterium]|nr:unnamed protein product [Gemmataceae bacterium]VTT99536.1 unnamed protein product [Gemmataceae bacterium]
MEAPIVASVRRVAVVGVVLIGSMAGATAAVAGLTVYVTELTLDFIRVMDYGASRRHRDDPRSGCPGDSNSVVVRHRSDAGR